MVRSIRATGEEANSLKECTLHNCRWPSFEHYRIGKVIDVYDGDTFTVAFEVNLPHQRFELRKVRLMGVDTPELRDKDPAKAAAARDARDFVVGLIMNKIIVVQVVTNTRINNRLIADKYGRLMCHIYYDELPDATYDFIAKCSDDEFKQFIERDLKCNLANELITAAHAKKYDGGHKD